MGGGIGISGHGSVRVVTERSRLAMPEVRIGLAPDVGGAHLLARAPGELGTHLALTAASFDGADAIAIGIADRARAVRAPARADGMRWPRRRSPPARSRERFAEAPRPVGPARAALLDRRVLRGRRRRRDPPPARRRTPTRRAGAAAAAIRAGSPTSAAVSLGALRRAREWNDLRRTLAQDLRVSTGLFAGHDLHEGIRAQLVDKDRTPHWEPATADGVDPGRRRADPDDGSRPLGRGVRLDLGGSHDLDLDQQPLALLGLLGQRLLHDRPGGRRRAIAIASRGSTTAASSSARSAPRTAPRRAAQYAPSAASSSSCVPCSTIAPAPSPG